MKYIEIILLFTLILYPYFAIFFKERSKIRPFSLYWFGNPELICSFFFLFYQNNVRKIIQSGAYIY